MAAFVGCYCYHGRRRLLRRLWVAVAALVTGTIWLWSTSSVAPLGTYMSQIQMVGGHLLHRGPIGLVSFYMCPPRAYKTEPPRDAPVTWYKTSALENIRKYGVIYLTPFSQRLAEEIDDPELQRLRCRVNYHTLQFKPNIRKTNSDIVNKLRSEGHFMSSYLRFELDMIAYAGCIDIYTPKEQEILLKYREEKFKNKTLVHRERRLIGKYPLTRKEVPVENCYIGERKKRCRAAI